MYTSHKVGLTTTLVLVVVSLFSIGSTEMDKVQNAHQQANDVLVTTDEQDNPYTVAHQLEDVFAGVLFASGDKYAREYGQITGRKKRGVFVMIDGALASAWDAYLYPPQDQSVRSPTVEEVAAHYYSFATYLLSDSPHDGNSRSLLALILLGKILGLLILSGIPLGLSLAHQFLFYGLITVTITMLACAYFHAANAQYPIHLMKTTASYQDGVRSTSVALFRIYPQHAWVGVMGAKDFTFGGGPHWTLNDSLTALRSRVIGSFYHLATLTTDGSRVTDFKFWNVATLVCDKFKFMTQSFASVPVVKEGATVLYSENQLLYQVKRFAVGVRDVVVVVPKSEWTISHDVRPAVEYALNKRLKGLVHIGAFGNAPPSVTMEVSFVF